MKVIISILHYKNLKDTIECLESLDKINFDNNNVRVLVIDNSQDAVINIEDFKNLNLEVLKTEKNLGFTGGHNTAFNYVKNDDYDLFLLLNNDCYVDKDFLVRLIKPFERKEVGGAVSKIYFAKGNEYHKDKYDKSDLGKVIWFAGGYIDWKMVTSQHVGLDEVDKGQYDNEKSVTFATGACFAIKKSVLNKTGLFDDNFFLYYEDADLSTKIIKEGYKLIYVPDSIIWHKNAGSSGSGSKLHDYYLTRNRLYFGMKYASIKMKILLLKEGFRLLISGREWQKKGVSDYLLHKLGKGSFIP